MQQIDPDDPRKKKVQITASLRAAILTGEFEPGTRLPSGNNLAMFFGVSRVTVLAAISNLEAEGFVRSVGGSGVFVRDQATLPVAESTDHPLDGVASFLFEMGQLKNQLRSGWLLLGIPKPESVAEHSFRVGMICGALAAVEGADVFRCMALGLFHDGHETRIGDVPNVGRAYVKTAAPAAVTAHQTVGMPANVANVFQHLTAEYEENTTIEAKVAHDADKLETLLQAIEYANQGYDTSAWKETSLAALRTHSGQWAAQAILLGDPQWWGAFAASYHELRKSTRAAQE